ncbi:DUF4347 domain-containing protein [Nostoc sp.]
MLESHQGITSLHIVSHGAPGCIYLGNSRMALRKAETLMG